MQGIDSATMADDLIIYKCSLSHNYVLGGCLKTPKDADSESLQAKWVKDPAELNLRSNDICGIIEKSKSYQARSNEPWHANVLPIVAPHHKLLLRLVVCIRKRSK